MRRRCLVVVVDDSLRFALHVWRYLGGGLGFGIGRRAVAWQGGSRQSTWFNQAESEGSASLETALGDVTVKWVKLVPETKTVQQAVESACGALGSWEKIVLVVDVHIESDDGTDTAASETALGRVLELYWKLNEPFRKHVVWFVVSSLAVEEVEALDGEKGGERARDGVAKIYPKAPGTLQEIARTVRASPTGSAAQRSDEGQAEERSPPEQANELHVLVTGAGFEYPSSGGGVRYFGVPGIERLLLEMERPFLRKGSTSTRGGEPHMVLTRGMKLPEVTAKVKGRSVKGGVTSERAADMSLDQWWDEVLQQAEKLVEEGAVSEVSTRTAVREQERSLREAFRQVFLRYDYGQLLQALCAAQLNWTVWLTTNYTRFAERAVASSDYWARERINGSGRPPSGSVLFPVLRGSKVAERPFRTIDTSAEAIFLTRELEAQPAERVVNKNRLLFKLHGDITHLRTMAIAGEDKQAFSQLSLPVDDLHLVYASAASLLSRYLQDLRVKEGDKFRERRLIWHIVGHGLQDEVLIELIGRVRTAVPQVPMVFKIVQPSGPAADQALAILKAGLAKAMGSNSNDDLGTSRIEVVDRTAERYVIELAWASHEGEIRELGSISPEAR